MKTISILVKDDLLIHKTNNVLIYLQVSWRSSSELVVQELFFKKMCTDESRCRTGWRVASLSWAQTVLFWRTPSCCCKKNPPEKQNVDPSAAENSPQEMNESLLFLVTFAKLFFGDVNKVFLKIYIIRRSWEPQTEKGRKEVLNRWWNLLIVT